MDSVAGMRILVRATDNALARWVRCFAGEEPTVDIPPRQ